MRPQHPPVYLLTCSKEMVVFLHIQESTPLPLFKDKRTAPHRSFNLVIEQGSARFFCAPGFLRHLDPFFLLYDGRGQRPGQKNGLWFLKIEFHGPLVRCFNLFDEPPLGNISWHLKFLYDSTRVSHILGGQLRAIRPPCRPEFYRVGKGRLIKGGKFFSQPWDKLQCLRIPYQ